VSQAWRIASIRSFEQVPVDITRDLLRVDAVSQLPPGPEYLRPTLLADDGRTVSRFRALAAPPDTHGTLRSAYSTPHEIVSPETVFSLEFEDGLVLALPQPTPFMPVTGPAPVAPRRPEPTDDWSDSLAGLLLAAAHARAELRATHELSALGDVQAADPHAEYVADDVEARIAEATDRADSAMLQLAAERDLHEDLRARYAELEAQTRDGAQRVETAERERTEALTARDAAEQSTAPQRNAQAQSDSDLLELRDQVYKMGLERDELRRQAAAFDEVAVKARERATAAEAEQRAASARLAELEIWSGELERRLAEATTSLAKARATAELDDSELQSLRGELADAQAQLELLQEQALGVSSVPARPLPGLPRERMALSAAELDELRRAAVRDADRRAERDLVDHAS
jgi:hypothetical protein